MDEKPLVIIYEKYHQKVFLYLYSLCHDQDLAEDLTQETFLKALLSLKNDHVNIRAWLYMVARNLFYDHYRKRKREMPVNEVREVLEKVQTETGSTAEGPLDQLLVKEKQLIMLKALAELPKQQCEVLMLQYFGGLSQREIAAVVGVSPENVRVLAYRGKRNLRKRMEDEDDI